MALCSNKAILIGRAKVREVMQSINSIALLPTGPLGKSLNFSRTAFPRAGKNRTGSGRTNLETAVSVMAFLPAAIDLPYFIVPS
jgi:hypothetical protein